MEFDDILIYSEFLNTFGPYALLILILAIILQCHIPLLPFPFISAICGLLFGFQKGVLISWFSVIIGSSIAFHLFRFLKLDQFIQNLLSRYYHGPAIKDKYLFAFIIIAHNIPIIPIAIPNIMASLSKLSFIKFLIATAIGLFIPSLIFAGFGAGIETFLIEPNLLTIIPIIIVIIIVLVLNKVDYKKILNKIPHFFNK